MSQSLCLIVGNEEVVVESTDAIILDPVITKISKEISRLLLLTYHFDP